VSLYKIAHVIQDKTVLQAAGEGHAGGATLTFDREPLTVLDTRTLCHFVTAPGVVFIPDVKLTHRRSLRRCSASPDWQCFEVVG
jgi:hypothetical protein